MEQKYFNLQLPEALHLALKKEAVARQIPMKALIVILLEEALESENV